MHKHGLPREIKKNKKKGYRYIIYVIRKTMSNSQHKW
jgi:hypothetical protein